MQKVKVNKIEIINYLLNFIINCVFISDFLIHYQHLLLPVITC